MVNGSLGQGATASKVADLLPGGLGVRRRANLSADLQMGATAGTRMVRKDEISPLKLVADLVAMYPRDISFALMRADLPPWGKSLSHIIT